MKMNENVRKELKQWAILAIIALALYLTGLHTEVIGLMQRGLLATGLIRPHIELTSQETTENLPAINLDVSLLSDQGQSLNLQQLQGKVLFINFWATWCPPCLAEMPNVDRLYRDLKGEDIQFILISTDQDFSKAVDFIQKKGYQAPIFHLQSYLPEGLNSNTLPTTFVINKQGKVVFEHRGMAQYNTNKFKAFLRGLL